MCEICHGQPDCPVCTEPMYNICPVCDGDGYYYDEQEQDDLPCPHCEGEGVIYP